VGVDGWTEGVGRKWSLKALERGIYVLAHLFDRQEPLTVLLGPTSAPPHNMGSGKEVTHLGRDEAGHGQSEGWKPKLHLLEHALVGKAFVGEPRYQLALCRMSFDKQHSRRWGKGREHAHHTSHHIHLTCPHTATTSGAHAPLDVWSGVREE